MSGRINGETEWDRTHRIKRVLRGCGSSPGFVEDWAIAGALCAEDVAKIVDIVAKVDVVELAHLCAFCRQYQGPVPDDDVADDDRAA